MFVWSSSLYPGSIWRGQSSHFRPLAGAGAGAGVLMVVHAASQLLIVVEENYLYWCFVWAENAQELRNGTNTRFILFCSQVSSFSVPQNNLILWNVLEIFCIFSHILQASQKAFLVYYTFLFPVFSYFQVFWCVMVCGLHLLLWRIFVGMCLVW